MKASLRDIFCTSTYLNSDSKIGIHQSAIRPVITYAAGTWQDTTKTQKMIREVEINVLTSIHGKTLHDRVRNEDIRQQSGVQDI